MREETKNHEDQAEELRKLFNEVESQGEDNRPLIEDTEIKEEGKQDRDVDILNLPPRKEVHGGKNTGTRFKVSRASLRLVTVIVILFLVIAGAYYLWGPELSEIINGL
ncbi:hypothetical protein ACFO3D_04225 [Virgibacillus kekensis]|uniref:Uncharacterized protein n=1 Tax=Virgibacillus kekensis TaxID=202261 RepID=A0ABV9DF21_9BACI